MSGARAAAAPARRVVVITTAELAVGYRLAGVTALATPSAADAAQRLRALVDGDEETGIVAVHEPYLDALDASTRRELEALTSPLVVALPSGEADTGEVARRRQMLASLWRAIGYQMTFSAGGEE